MAFVVVAASEGKTLPPGFRFHPTDEEIVSHYLKNKVFGRKPDIEVIREIDLYKCEPWDLPEKSILPTRDAEWYFFSPRDKKYPNGSRSNRATEKGYWKATGKDRKVNSQSNKIGMKKTLVFYKGRAPQGQRTNWLMHEYRLDESQCRGATHLQNLYVICRVFKKERLVSRDGEQNGIPSDEIVEQADETPIQQIQEDDYPSPSPSGVPSEISSDILDNKADGSVESSQVKSNPDCGAVLKNADDELENQAPLPDPFPPSNFIIDPDEQFDIFGPSIPDFSLEDYNEQFFLQIFGEANNEEVFTADDNDGIPFNDFNFVSRSQPTTWQSQYQSLPCQGTAARRIRLQWNDNNNDDSEVVTEQEDSGITSLPRQTCSLEEDDAGSDIFSTGESTLGSEKSVTATGSEEKSTLTEISDSLSSPECIESKCAQPGPLTPYVLQDNSENPREQFNNSVGSVVIPVAREQAMLKKSKHVNKCDLTTSMSNVLEGDTVLVKEGIESPAEAKRGSTVSDAAIGFDSMQVKTIGSQSVAMHKTSIKCKESVKHTGFRLTLRGLKLRGKSTTKDTVVCGKECNDVIKRPSYHSKEFATGFVNLGNGNTDFVNLGKASSIFIVTGLLATAVLVCFTWSYGS